MKITVFGDIHGRSCWKSIVEKEKNSDLFVFLGDYVSTHDGQSEKDQIDNFESILQFKEKEPSKVILLRGNHLNQHLGYYWADCSGYFRNVGIWCRNNKERILNNTQWIYVCKLFDKPIIFSHAGMSELFMQKCKLDLPEEINNIQPCELFGFCAGPDNPFDYYGDSIYQPCEWIRPSSLCRVNLQGYTQVVGHTPVKKIKNIQQTTKNHESIYLCDCLPKQYLVIDNNKFIIKSCV